MKYPYRDGDFIILGPGIFAYANDVSVVSINGENYVPQRPTLRVRLYNLRVRLFNR